MYEKRVKNFLGFDDRNLVRMVFCMTVTKHSSEQTISDFLGVKFVPLRNVFWAKPRIQKVSGMKNDNNKLNLRNP